MWSRTEQTLLLLLVLLLAGCGFHLRGTAQVPPELRRMAVVGLMPSDALRRTVEEYLVGAGVRVVAPGEGVPVLRVLARQSRRDILSVGSDGRVREYRLIEGMRVRLERGDAHGPEQVFRVERVLLYDPDDVLGKQAEENWLREEMHRDLALQLLVALKGMHPKGAAGASSTP